MARNLGIEPVPLQDELFRRDRLLGGVAEAARQLLSVADFDTAVNGALEAIALAAGIDRIFVYQHHVDAQTQKEFASCPYEWTVPGVVRSYDLPGQYPMFYSEIEGYADWLAELKAGKTVQKLARDMSKAGQVKQVQEQALSVLTVPIFIEGNFWGNFGFDDCTTERIWNEAEISVLKTAAACIGSAIERDDARKEREATAQARAIELETHNQELAARDRILEATAAAANVMLTEDNFDHAVSDALQIIGVGLEVDRVGLMKHFGPPSNPSSYHQQLFEWVVEGLPIQLNHPELVRISDAGIEFAVERLSRGEIFGGIVADLPEPFRSGQQELGVQSTYAVPIIVSDCYWGIVALDDCHQQTERSEAELGALRTLANCVGSAIEREQLRQAELQAQAAREAAERTALIERERAARAVELEAANQVLSTRDRWLTTTALAAKQLLSSNDVAASVDQALATIGENLDCDRISVMQHHPSPDTTEETLGSMRVIHEWDGDGICRQMESPDLVEIVSEGVEDWFKQLLAGDSVGGIVAEMEEPFRSGQQSLGVQATYAVPVLVEGLVWGLVAMDYCHEPKRLTPAELAVFQTAATCVGSSIYQEQARRDQAAQESARLLGSVAEAANLLLRSADYTTVLPEVTRLLGEAVGSDRCAIATTQSYPVAPTSLISIAAEWCRDGVMAAHHATPELATATWQQFPELYKHLQAEEVANYLVTELSESNRNLFKSQDISSVVYLPIVVDGKPWGQIGFDNCGEPRLYDEAEISILRVAAESIAAAISRQAQDEALHQSEQAILAEREKAAQERAAELAKVNRVLKKTIDTLVIEPELSKFLGYVLQAIALQFDSPFLEYWRNGQDNIAYLELVIINGEVLTGKQLTGHHGVQGLMVHPDMIDSETLFQRTQHTVYNLSPTDDFIGPFYNNIHQWCQSHGVDLPGKAFNFPVVLGEQSFGAIAIFLPSARILPEETIELGYALANQAALALQLTRLAEEAKQTALLQEQERAAQERVLELARTNEAIAQSLTDLASNPELEPFLGAIVAEMARQLNACKVHLFLYDAPSHTLTQRVAVQEGQIYIGVGPNDPEMFSHPIPADLTLGWQTIITADRPLTYDETQPYDEDIWWPESLEWHKTEGHRAITCIPMKAGETPIGYIGFCFYDRTFITDEQLEFMQALTNQAIVAIQLTRLADETKQTAIVQEQQKATQERAAELAKTNEAIAQTLDVLTATPELDDFLGQILTQVIEQIDADYAHLFLYNAETETLRSHLVVQDNTIYPGNAPGDPEVFRQDLHASSTAGWRALLESSKPITFDTANPESAEFYWPTTPEWHNARGHQSATCACMKIGDQAIGMLGFASCHHASLTEEKLEFIQALTNQATLAIHLTRLAEQARTNALTDERNRLAREIHDTLAQTFTGISLQLEAVRSLTHQPNATVESLETAQTYIRRARDLARKGLSEARRSVRALRSEALETDDLPNALRKALAQTQRDHGLSTHFRLEGEPIPLPDDLQLNLLRIAQEAITNVLRHAKATQLDLTLRFQTPHIQLRITDNGVGFETSNLLENSGFGLIGIRERAARFYGSFALQSSPTSGTTLKITIPLESTLELG